MLNRFSPDIAKGARSAGNDDNYTVVSASPVGAMTLRSSHQHLTGRAEQTLLYFVTRVNDYKYPVMIVWGIWHSLALRFSFWSLLYF